MRIYYKLLGAHYHCRVFTNGLNGTLVFDEAQWPGIKEQLSKIAVVQHEEVVVLGQDWVSRVTSEPE